MKRPLAVTLVLLLAGCRRDPPPAPIVAQPAEAKILGCTLRGELVPDGPAFVGRAAYATFRLKTDCAAPIKRQALPDDQVRLSVVDAWGNDLPELTSIDPPKDGSYATSTALSTFESGEIVERITITKAYALRIPGTFKLTAKKSLLLGTNKDDVKKVDLTAVMPLLVLK